VEITGYWRKLHKQDLHYLNFSTALTGQSNQGESDWQSLWNVLERKEMHAGFWWRNLRKETTWHTYMWDGG
jgi:hypothetical protein